MRSLKVCDNSGSQQKITIYVAIQLWLRAYTVKHPNYVVYVWAHFITRNVVTVSVLSVLYVHIRRVCDQIVQNRRVT